MKKSQANIRKISRLCICLLSLVVVMFFWVSPGQAINTLNDYTSYPPFLATETPPNVIIALDISGSMKQSAYTQPGKAWKTATQNDYNKDYKYFGYFDSTKKYSYDSSNQFFTVDVAGEWDGNFLNWLTMRRIDVARKVIVGGKVSVKTKDQDAGYTKDDGTVIPPSPTFGEIVPINRNEAKNWTDWQDDWDGWYVLEGQYEPYDYQFYKQYSANATENLTPSGIADNSTFLINNQRLIPQVNAGGNALALSDHVEVGTVTMNWDILEEEWIWVPFKNTYVRPRVVAKAQTYNGSDPMSDPRIRLENGWDATNNTGFYVRLQEWDYRDGNHTSETFSYIVVESKDGDVATPMGCMAIPDDNGQNWYFCADGDSQPVDSADCGDLADASVTGEVVAWEAVQPPQTPIVFTGVTTWTEGGDTSALNTRNYNISTTQMTVTIQEQESNGGGSKCTHATVEQVAAIAIVPPLGTAGTSAGTWTNGTTSIKLQAGYLSNVNNNWKTLTYDTSATSTTFVEKPIFLAEMQTANGSDPATIRVDGSAGNNNKTQINLKVHEEKSDDTELNHADEDVGWLAIEYVSGYAIRVGVTEEPIGLMQKVANSMRLGVAVYNYDHDKSVTGIYNGNTVHGGTLSPCYPDTNLPVDQRTNYDICLSTGVADPVNNSIRVVEEHPLIWGSTPIAETLVEIKNYVQQASATGTGYYDDKSTEPTYPFDSTDDPYYYSDLGTKLDCASTFVLHFNDGEPYRDWDGSGHPSIVGDGDGATGLNEMLDDVAFSMRNVDLRSDSELPGHQEVISYYVLAALGESDSAQYSTATRRLREAAINGGFVDSDGDHAPDVAHPANINTYMQDNEDASTGLPDCTGDENEWDADGDCNPDTFYFANDGYALEQELADAFLSIEERNASGTAASVISNTRSGEGAIYQSVFFPEYISNGTKVEWVGQLHALLVDAYGNMREDTNNNAQLDLAEDLFITYQEDPDTGEMKVYKYRDGVVVDGVVTGSNGIFDDYEWDTVVEIGSTETIDYLWSSTDWLNADSGVDALDPLTQRGYATTNRQRYIFTFLDDGDMLAESGEVIGFTTANKASIAPYLHAFEPFAYTAASPPTGIEAADFNTFVDHQADRLIEWIRGEDQGSLSFSSSVIPPMRSRHYKDSNNIARTWRLGDIVNSTPTVVGRPAENFDLLYYDQSFSEFYTKYKTRRNVVYVGGNDGMFHAFNAGFYDTTSKQYMLRPQVWDDVAAAYVEDTSKTEFDLGAEMWAYVPFNLLPHLYWLSDPDYTHVYYVDMKPKIFDANIFPDDTVHPNGWGTVLVGGMRFGGGKINADINKDGVLDASDPAMTSAYFIFDITDPETAPTLLAEITLPGLGYTTNYPMVIALRDRGMTGAATGSDINDWYLFLGSGPANAAGEPDDIALDEASSKQPGKIFLLDLNVLGKSAGQDVCFMNSVGTCVSSSASPVPLVSLDTNSFISEAIGVDWDFDFKNDAVYFGTVSGDETNGWGGKLRRLKVGNSTVITSWDLDNVFLDLSDGSIPGLTTGQPITAAPSAGLDTQGNRWIFVGTGRYYTPTDSYNTDQQSYYGLKETKDVSDTFDYATLNRNTTDLFDSSDVKVYEGGADVKNAGSASSFSLLRSELSLKNGWFMDFSDSKERNLGQAALLGKILTFTTYVPNDDPCAANGNSWVYALNYETGTAHEYPVIGTDPDDTTTASDNVEGQEKVLKRVSIGEGLATSPGLHTGREGGAKAFIQSSTGAITTFEQSTPGRTKSGMTSWQFE